VKGRGALVFTDLDGTLLDHRTYRWDAARPALEALRERGVPVVLCSSKTRAEMLAIQEALGLRGPMVVENGGAVLSTGTGALEQRFPERLGELPARVFGVPYGRLRTALEALRAGLPGRITGFGDVDDEAVARWTGLPLERARLARLREFDEPFLWKPEPSSQVVDTARARATAMGLQLTRGGRFWHLTGDNDKGRAVRWLVEAAAAAWGRPPRTLALGDSENDLPMLIAADEGVLVERHGGGFLEPRPPGIRTVHGQGPEGWCRAVLAWLARKDPGP